MARNIRFRLLDTLYCSSYTMYPGSTTMYHDFRLHYWWKCMKKDVADFVAKCITCQQVKAKHQKPTGIVQSLDIPEWKWDKITMDLATKLPWAVIHAQFCPDYCVYFCFFCFELGLEPFVILFYLFYLVFESFCISYLFRVYFMSNR